jgi:hypothetical protein
VHVERQRRRDRRWRQPDHAEGGSGATASNGTIEVQQTTDTNNGTPTYDGEVTARHVATTSVTAGAFDVTINASVVKKIAVFTK